MKVLFTMLLVAVLIVGCGQQEYFPSNSNEVEDNGVPNSPESSDQDKAAESNQSTAPVSHEEVFNSGLQVGQIPPSFALLPTLSGDILSESKLEGKKVLINFWATWCGPCRTEMPDIIRLDKEYDDLMVIAINVGEKPEDVLQFVKEFGMEFPVLLDETTELTELYQVLALPTTYFLGTDGTIARKHIGSITYNQMLHTYQNIE
jgi:thiol-disulfide isomerase/thioredoxin